jgi:uncharacterized membrane protein YGL010W
MRSVQSWLAEYGESHRHPVNRALHYLCIPLIVLSLVMALLVVPVGGDFINPASALLLASLLWYAVLSLRLAAGMAVVFALLYALALALDRSAGPAALPLAGFIFAVAWVGQFYGHHLEGVRPAFVKDLQFLLVGPLWELAHLYEALRFRLV